MWEQIIDKKLFIIAGPCVIESEERALMIGREMKRIADGLGVYYIFKASCDKANRTSAGAKRGPGMEEGLKILSRIKKELGTPVLTDIHEAGQAASAAEVADILQIPAFLCRQTDLLLAAGRTGRVVNIKKGQFLAPEDMGRAAEKVKSSGNGKIILTERGVSFGYHNLVVDMRAIPIMKRFGLPVVMDATHSVQLPGGAGHSTSGQREFVPTLARAAVAAGADGLFFEVHDCPEEAWSDGPNMLKLEQAETLLRELLKLHALVKTFQA
ncbi:MAG: 3-deoxy-8-phosphooctulonate synthase [Bacillota bacterium]